jgi:hypothetical protein
MPSRRETLTRTARKIVLGRNDLEVLVAAGMSLATVIYSMGVLLARLVMFLTLPLSALLLYPLARANTRRWFKWAQEQQQRRAELIAELTSVCSKSVEWPHDWATPIPADDLRRAVDEQDRADGVDPVDEAQAQPGDRERIDALLRQVWDAFDSWAEQEKGLARTVWLHAERVASGVDSDGGKSRG